MNSKIRKLNRGFTIIEVMIVLAIAGLILAIVFIAVPQLQRNTRDNARQDIATRVKAELETYASNNQGSYPFTGAGGAYAACNTGAGGATLTCQDFMYRYIYNSSAAPVVKINDPSTGTASTIYIGYDAAAAEATGRAWGQGRIYIAVGDKCNGDQPDAAGTGSAGSANSKKYATVVALDRTNTWYCVDNG